VVVSATVVDPSIPTGRPIRMLRICGVVVAEDVIAERTEVRPPVRRLRATGNPHEAKEK
jgi:hypothetical protein